MEHSIESRILNRTVTFSRPGQSYVYVDLNGHSGTLGQQLCEGGYLSGFTVSYWGNDEAGFRRLCQRWYRAYVRNSRFANLRRELALLEQGTDARWRPVLLGNDATPRAD